MNAAVHVHVSTGRKAARGFDPVVYEEVESAAKRRPVLDRVRRRSCRPRKAITVWALARLHRSMIGPIRCWSATGSAASDQPV